MGLTEFTEIVSAVQMKYCPDGTRVHVVKLFSTISYAVDLRPGHQYEDRLDGSNYI